MKASRLRAYYRLTKPGIIYGNLLYTVAGFFLGAQGTISWSLLAPTIAGVALVIASACVWNNLIDRDIDKNMARTEKRALVTGEISLRSAGLYAAVLGLLGFAVLVFYVNILTAALGVLAVFMYVVVYGIAKRKTVYGTLVGSISGALPPVGGYAAAAGQVDMGALLLFLVLVVWQMPHFYAIAIYRGREYAKAHIPLLPLVKGVAETKRQIIAYIAAYIVAASLLTVYGYTGYVYVTGVVAVGGMWFAKALAGLRTKDDNAWARQQFRFSLVVTLVFCALVVVDAWLP